MFLYCWLPIESNCRNQEIFWLFWKSDEFMPLFSCTKFTKFVLLYRSISEISKWCTCEQLFRSYMWSQPVFFFREFSPVSNFWLILGKENQKIVRFCITFPFPQVPNNEGWLSFFVLIFLQPNLAKLSTGDHCYIQ